MYSNDKTARMNLLRAWWPRGLIAGGILAYLVTKVMALDGAEPGSVGGAGNLAVAFVLPLMGGWYDAYGAATAFRYVAFAPLILIFTFEAFYFYYRSQGGYRPVQLTPCDHPGLRDVSVPPLQDQRWAEMA